MTSALAFVLAGAGVVLGGRVRGAIVLGVATAAVGAGSIAFHGTTSAWSTWFHDTTLAALVAILALGARLPAGLSAPRALGAAAALGSVLLVFPGVDVALMIGVAVGGGVLELSMLPQRRQAWILAAAALLAGGGALAYLGRTAGPWCAPSSLLQPHAGWHALAAAAVVAYAMGRGWLAGPTDTVTTP